MMIDLNTVTKRIEALEKRVKDLETHNDLLIGVIEEIYDNIDKINENLEIHDNNIKELQEKHNGIIECVNDVVERINLISDKLNTLLRLFKIINL